jgi:hypothetical protein
MNRLRRSGHRHPYAWIVGVLWVLPWLLMVTGYLVLPDDDWEYGCGSFGCGWPSNIAYPLFVFWAWLYLLVPSGLLAVMVVFVWRHRRALGLTE